MKTHLYRSMFLVTLVFCTGCFVILLGPGCSERKSSVDDPVVQLQRTLAEGTPLSVALSPDLRSFATGGYDGSASIWDLGKGSKVKTYGGRGKAWVPSVAISPDGQRLAAGVDDTVKIWDINSGKEISSLKCPADVYKVGFSPDGKIVASSGTDKAIVLWDAATGTEIRNFQAGSPWAFSADGKILASTTSDKNIQFWRVTDGNKADVLQPKIQELGIVTFSPDGKMLAVSGDKVVQLWDLVKKKPLYVFENKEPFTRVAFSPDNKFLVASSFKIVKMWDARTGTEVRQFPSTGTRIDSLAFDADGKTLYALGWDRTVERWEVESGDPIKGTS